MTNEGQIRSKTQIIQIRSDDLPHPKKNVLDHCSQIWPLASHETSWLTETSWILLEKTDKHWIKCSLDIYCELGSQLCQPLSLLMDSLWPLQEMAFLPPYLHEVSATLEVAQPANSGGGMWSQTPDSLSTSHLSLPPQMEDRILETTPFTLGS